MFDKYIQQGAWRPITPSTGTHVRVGSDIEQASAIWLAERLATAANLSRLRHRASAASLARSGARSRRARDPIAGTKISIRP